MYKIPISFEWDLLKNERNKAVHGASFENAKDLWSDPNSIETDARATEEKRFAKIGIFNGKIWTAFFTVRNGKVRLFSFRRANKKEALSYEQEKENNNDQRI